jgi:vacuolar-type H+-ATPase subunit I/STV1
MNSPQQPQPKTRLFARVMGPFLIIIPGTAVLQASEMRTLLSDFAENPLWCWVVGAFILLVGLVVIALHQYWHGGPGIIVSAIGWLVALKGLFLVAFPRTYMSAANAAIDAVSWWRAAFIVFALVGVYLTYVGWAPARSLPAPRAASSKPDLPRAA